MNTLSELINILSDTSNRTVGIEPILKKLKTLEAALERIDVLVVTLAESTRRIYLDYRAQKGSHIEGQRLKEQYESIRNSRQ